METINGVAHTTGYTYDEDNRVATVTQDGRTETLTYDALGRLIASIFDLGELESTRSYTYNPNSSQIAELDIAAGEFDETYSYTYDGNGNILSVRRGDYETSYVYDSANQLVRENHQQQNKTWTWEYDDAGNILCKTEYAYTTGALGEPLDTVLYAYGDTQWGDLLTSFDGNPITYDGVGNPLTDGTWTYTWEHGRELASMSAGDEDDGEVTITYGYDANGMRTSKTVTAYTYEDVVVHTHSYRNTTVFPACTKPGYTYHECNCGAEYLDNYVPALGHNFVLRDMQRVCLRCGYVDTGDIIDPIRPIDPPIDGGEIMSVNPLNDTPPPDVTERVLASTAETVYSYVYDGGQLRQMTITTTVTTDEETTTQTETQEFTYDASGAPQTLTYGNSTYLYVTNLQGDVLAILDTDGTPVVEYTYDAWGKILDTTGSMADTLGADNPLRYRGYVYDTETGFYYLQSRYYDPEICRFINADSYTFTGQGLLGNNMFVYCLNNPVIYLDRTGRSAALPPMIENGLNLPTSGGIPVVIDGTTYYYAIDIQNGQLYEYWFDADGNLIWGRHHSDHNKPWKHDDPHDHKGGKDKNGNNTLVDGPQPVDEKFHGPDQISHERETNLNAGHVVAGVVVGVAIYQIVKWTVATILAPATGGCSYAVAALAP